MSRIVRRGLGAGLAAGAATLAAVSGARAQGAQAPDGRFARILNERVVRIGVPLDVPPFGSQNAERRPVGFDVEMAEMVARGLDARLELQQITGANRIPFLLSDRVDMVISAMGLTPERARQIMFSAPYANTFLAVYGRRGVNVASAGEVGSNRIAAARGTTQELALSATNPRAQIMRTEDDATAAAAYLSGQAQLFATNSIVAQELAQRNPNVEFDRKFVIRRSPCHVGVRMGEHSLARWLDSFVFFNTMNGELERLHQRYLGIAMDPLPAL